MGGVVAVVGSPAAVEAARVTTSVFARESVTAPLRSAARSEVAEEEEEGDVASALRMEIPEAPPREEEAAWRPRQPAPLRTTARRVMRAMRVVLWLCRCAGYAKRSCRLRQVGRRLRDGTFSGEDSRSDSSTRGTLESHKLGQT